MPEHTNFYENAAEARIRLRGTVVTYDGFPYLVMAICDHEDGFLRAYLRPTGEDYAKASNSYDPTANYPQDHSGLDNLLDKYMTDNPSYGIIRKKLNSPKFNKFRPFPLGMVNVRGRVYYAERGPARPSTSQGLTGNMVHEHYISTGGTPDLGRYRPTNISLTDAPLRSTIIGEYPSVQECLTALLNPKIENEAAAFHREFAIVRGPIEMLFLAYREDVIGVLPNKDLTQIRLGREFKHCVEVVQQLGIFGTILNN